MDRGALYSLKADGKHLVVDLANLSTQITTGAWLHAPPLNKTIFKAGKRTKRIEVPCIGWELLEGLAGLRQGLGRRDDRGLTKHSILVNLLSFRLDG
jgi:hypothetical protein